MSKWCIGGINNISSDKYAAHITQGKYKTLLWITSQVAACCIIFEDNNKESCVTITLEDRTINWYYTLKENITLLITIEEKHIKIIGRTESVILNLPNRLWLMNKNTISNYERKITQLTLENEELREEIKELRKQTELTNSSDILNNFNSSGYSEKLIESDEIIIEKHFSFDNGEIWSLEDCINSVFQKGTTHYKSVALLCNSFIQAEKDSETRNIILSSLKDKLHKNNTNTEIRDFAIRCLRRIMKKNQDPNTLNYFWKECSETWEYQPYINIPFNELELGELIGQGTFGTVVKGYWNNPDNDNKIPVAIKFIQESFQFDIKDLRNEFIALSLLDHPNIINMYGSGYYREKQLIGSDITTWFIIMDQMKCSLHDMIYKYPEKLTLDIILQIIKEIAEGLLFLHTCQIIHRDIKPENILLDEEFHVKIGDLGIVKPSTGTKLNTIIGTSGYMAPELHVEVARPGLKTTYSPNVDVFSFGIVVWELYSKCKPTFTYKKKKRGYVCDIPIECPHIFTQLIKQCTQYLPQKRPSFKKILQYLNTESAKRIKRK